MLERLPYVVGARRAGFLRERALLQEREEQAQGADLVAAHEQRLTQRAVEHLLGRGRERDPLGRRFHPGPSELTHPLGRATDAFEGLARGAPRLGSQAEQ
ncbi:MAG TPA: hypothetical protein VHX88_21535 [Solirubrobacteraceae bacterium]|nr:hypothetical protein [Solirubrobacteraceae bacterium]